MFNIHALWFRLHEVCQYDYLMPCTLWVAFLLSGSLTVSIREDIFSGGAMYVGYDLGLCVTLPPLLQVCQATMCLHLFPEQGWPRPHLVTRAELRTPMRRWPRWHWHHWYDCVSSFLDPIITESLWQHCSLKAALWALPRSQYEISMWWQWFLWYVKVNYIDYIFHS